MSIHSETQVNTETTNAQQKQKITALSDGGWVITWQSNIQDGDNYGVFSQAYNADGTAQGVETQVNSYTAGHQLNAEIAALSDGGWVITWESNGQDGNLTGVFSQAFNADGTTQGSETRVNTHTTSSQYNQQITALSDGGWVITWQSIGQDGGGSGIYAQAYNADGTTQGGETQVNTYTTLSQTEPQIAALSDGGWVITWESSGQDGESNGIYAQTYNANGTPQGGEVPVNTYTVGDQNTPQVTALSDGGWVITWVSVDQDGDLRGAYAQAYNADGTPRGGEVQVNTETTGQQQFPTITALSDGGWVVTWTSPDGDIYGIYSQAYNADGSPQGIETQVNTSTAGDQYGHQTAALNDGGWVVMWASLGQDGSDSGVYAQVYNADGTPRGVETQVNAFTLGDQKLPQITVLSDGGWVITWTSAGQDGDSYGVYSQAYNADGTVNWGLPSDVTAFEAAASSLDLSAVHFGDAGADATFALTLTADSGTLEATSSGTVTVTGSGTGALILTGLPADIDAFLNTATAIQYTGAADVTGNNAASITLTANDGGTVEALGAVNVDITPVLETQVNTNTNNQQVNQQITALSDGGWVITWQSLEQDGDIYGIYAQAYNADGTTQGGETLVNTFTAGNQNIPLITALYGGSWVITWRDSGQDGSSDGVYAQAYNAYGQAFGGETRVNTETAGAQSYQQVAALSDGGWVITWDSPQDGGGYGVYAQAYNYDGTPQGTETQVNTETSLDQFNAQIASLSDGGWVISWQSIGQDGDSYGIYAQAYNADGSPLGGETQVNTYTAGNQTVQQIAALSDGGWVISWRSDGQDGDGSGIYAQAFDADGTAQGGETQVNSYTTSEQFAPQIAALEDGGWVITWTSTGQDGDLNGVYSQAYNADGSPLGGETLVNTHTTDQQVSPQITALEGGGWVITWLSNGQDGSSYGVYAQAYYADGSTQGDETQVNTYTEGNQYLPQIAALEGGGFAITWISTGQDGSDVGVFARSFQPVLSENVAVTLTGAQIAGHTLTAELTGLDTDDPRFTISYAWTVDGVIVETTSDNTFALTSAHVGWEVGVTVVVNDALFETATAQVSLDTWAIDDGNHDLTGTVLLVSDNADPAVFALGDTVTADVSGLADGDGLGTLRYQWLRSGEKFEGAQEATYTLTDEDEGHVLTVLVYFN
ncbi:beta strand repeat-containing protein, partial [Falsihalocynthiibacter arcticus]|uniref:beta strand repeat-containing protein n=1 Tax=Falsihalocynthiibacter arcticus TaxID=1579316 RepID=UPI003AB97D37